KACAVRPAIRAWRSAGTRASICRAARPTAASAARCAAGTWCASAGAAPARPASPTATGSASTSPPIIGRTDENDVVVNHRSISRHHAKIVRENGHYHIVDLQSANGVRVNGEEYGKVELRKGDHVDLGHVRLRFVAPG